MSPQTLFIKNIPPFFTDVDLKALIEKASKTKAVFIARNKKTQESRSFGYAKFPDEIELKKAESYLKNRQIENYQLNVEMANKRKNKNEKTKKVQISKYLLIKGIPANIDQKQFFKTVKKLNKIEHVIFPAPESTFGDFSARLIFKSEEFAKTAKLKIPKIFSNIKMNLSIYFLGKNEKLSRLIVRNAPFQINEKDFEKIFGQFGKIKEMKMPKDEKNNAKGYLFIEYENIESAAKAIDSLNGLKIIDRKIVVDWAISKLHYERIQQKREKISQKIIQKNKKFDQIKIDPEKKLIEKENLIKEDEELMKKNLVKKSKFGDVSEKRTIFISNLSTEITKKELFEAFKKIGRINYIKIVIDSVTK
ncbi:RNA-binding protein 28, partial [Bonamia ostreae]